MLPLTKMVRSVCRGFRGGVQTVACRKSLRSDLSMIASMSNAVSISPRRMAFLYKAFIRFCRRQQVEQHTRVVHVKRVY